MRDLRPRSLVTGASSGIGAAYARLLGREGHDLVLVARRQQRLEQLAASIRTEHGVDVLPIAADLSDERGVDRIVDEVRASRPLEVLVHGAGFGTRSLFAETLDSKLIAMVGLHVTAGVRLVRACLPGMIEGGSGRIVLVSSLGAFYTGARYVSYSATKSFLNMLCLGLAEELKGTGVSVQALCPGLTRTEFLETEEYADFKYDGVPAFAWMTAGQVAAESWSAFDRGRTVVVPGVGNRLFVSALDGPLGPLLRLGLAAASRLDGGEKTSRAASGRRESA